MRPAQDIEEPESSQAKDTFVATVHAIKSLPLPVMDTGSRQMRNPPHGEKQCQQQAIQVCAIGDPTGFDVPSTTFAILKRRFHAHAPGISLDLSASCSLIDFRAATVPHTHGPTRE